MYYKLDKNTSKIYKIKLKELNWHKIKKRCCMLPYKDGSENGSVKALSINQ